MINIIDPLSLIITQIIAYSTIYALASLGMVLCGRAGIFNISGEGVMATSASVAFAVVVISQNLVMGTLAAIIVGGIYGLSFIILHEKFKVNQFIVGICFIIAGTALGDLIFKIIITEYVVIPQIKAVSIINIPLLSQIPLVGGLFRQSIFTYSTYVLIIALWFFTYKTRKGLEYRAVGENPKGADVVGVSVTGTRVIATVLAGVLMGLGGAYLPLVVTGSYSIGMVAGRGFMAIGIAIFANWKPQRIFVSALIFAAFEVLATNLQVYVIRQNIYLVQALPFIAVLLIMVFGKQARWPSWLGEPYDRE